ncbi:tautomerase family protein [Streptomyces sp. NPDC004976]
MPFANFKVPAGTVTPEDKKKIVERTTDLYAEIYGERARATTVGPASPGSGAAGAGPRAAPPGR